MKTVPFQAQIVFQTAKGARYLRVISSESQTTTEATELKKGAQLPIVHHRIATNTAKMFSRGDYERSRQQSKQWNAFINREFTEEPFQKQQMAFEAKSRKLEKAVDHKQKKKRKPAKDEAIEEEDELNRSLVDSDEDAVEIMDQILEKRSWDGEEE